MKSVFTFGASLAAAVLVAVVALPACSSTEAAAPDPNKPITECDPTKCAPGNECIAMDGDLKCRKPCGSNVDPATSCPANYACVAANIPSTIPAACTKNPAPGDICVKASTALGTRLTAYNCTDKPPTCVAAEGGNYNWCCNDSPPAQLVKPVCSKLSREVTPGPKQWGAACNPTKGLDSNEDCDFAQGFFCYGTSPADAAAYCTRYTCESDRDCAGGFGCAAINVGPNVTTAKRTYHETTTACVRRDYGALCKGDVDCPPLTGRTQHCVPDDNGRGFCAPECADTKNCNFEAKCIDGGIGVKTCYPRAGVAVGDGSLCSPCRNDADCGEDGACIKGEYTTERFCAKKSAGACTANSNKCPPSSKAGVQLGCAVPEAGAATPLDNYCYGLYEFGSGNDLGCYTPAR